MPIQPNERIGAYEVVQQVGSGGHASVWLARDPVMNRYVAIKQFTFAQGDEGFRQRFLNEVRMQQRASELHPTIVRFIDAMDDPQHGLLLIMEYVDGFSLEQWLGRDGKPMEPAQVQRIMQTLAQALKAIHDVGMIHRDLKPSNLLIPNQNDQSPVRVCDLGLATMIAEQEALTLGSVRYMAPELFDGSTPADDRADLYSLGMIAYELLIGRAAFEQAFKTVLRDRRSTAMRWMKWHTNRRLPAPAASQLNPQVPAFLSELVSRLMDKDLPRRVQSAQELLEAMASHDGQAAKPITQPSARATHTAMQPAGDTAKLPTAKKWATVAALIAFIAVVLVGGGYLLITHEQAKRQFAQQAMQAREQLNQAWKHYEVGEYEQAREQMQAIYDTPNQFEHIRGRAEVGIIRLDIREAFEQQALQRVGDLLDELEGNEYIELSDLRQLRFELQSRKQFQEKLAELISAIENEQFGEAQRMAANIRNMSLTSYERVQFSEPASQLQMMLENRRVEQGLGDAQRHIAAGQSRRAIQLLEELQRRSADPRIIRQLDQLRRERQVQSFLAQAEQARSAGDTAQAILAFQQAYEVDPNPSYQQQIREIRAADLLAQASHANEQGRTAQARRLYLQVQSLIDSPIARAQLELMDSTQRITATREAAERARTQGNLQEAVALYEQAQDLAFDENIQQQLDQTRLAHAIAQARLIYQREQYEQATRAYEQVLSLDPENEEARAAIEQMAETEAYRRLRDEADVYRQQGRFREAFTLYREARDKMDTTEIRDRLSSLEFDQLVQRTRSLIEQGQLEEARAMLDTAASMRLSRPEIISELREALDERS